MKTPSVLFGIDQLLQVSAHYKNLRLALVTNNAATTSTGESGRFALRKTGFNIIKLFSPEHGLSARSPDGVHQANHIDPATGLPVISLYGDQLAPAEDDLAGIDAVLFDIPDAGCRFYTYLWTMTYVMEACAQFGKKLIILDRPNPISGDTALAEGPMLDETHCYSFIGRWSIPVRHSCTLGELAGYFAMTRIRDAELNIIRVRNWKREQAVKESGWFFSPPSPAIIDAETALLFPGIGFLEGLNVNEGRGTDFPFRIFGAPWINATLLAEAFQSLETPGITCKPCSYMPASGLYEHEECHGLRLIVTDALAFRPVQTGLRLIRLMASLYPEQLKERPYITRANPTGERHLDKLTGVDHSFEKIKNKGISIPGSVTPAWMEAIRPCLLY